MDIEEALRKHRDDLLRMPGISGVGIGADQEGQVILVMVSRLDPRLAEQLPRSVEGHRVVVQEVGDIAAL